MRMNERVKKALSALLCVSMLAQNAPVVAFAAQEDCTHHAEHTAQCGYVAAVEGKPCTHSHDAAVCGYAEAVEEVLCACAETDENGALVHTEGCSYVAPVPGADCTHSHDASCGYAAAVEGQACAYQCEICLGNDDEEEQEQETTAPSEPETTEATEEAEPAEPIELHQTVTIPLELDAAEFDNDEAFAAYVERLFYGDSGVSTFGPLAGERLQGAEEILYDQMKEYVAAIAAGDQAAADFRISSDVLQVSITLEQSDIGTDIFVQDGENLSITEGAHTALLNKFFEAVKVQQVLYALLSDCPYDLYWFDKANAKIYCEIGAAKDENGAFYAVITNLVLTLPVAKDYQDPETGAMNTDKIEAAAAAVEKAREIAAKHQKKTDYEKLVAYKNYICGEVSYNHEAVESDYQGGYGDPWQMIYVFDGNPNTKVVCEGYSKALQYLCDQSGVSCISVGGPFGDEKSNGPHLWNIVTLEGKNYLVDLTNSDENACGKNGELFLAGNASGSVDTGYSFDVGTGDHAGTVKYEYDPAFVAIWAPENLTLAKENYPVPETPGADECNHSGSTHSAVTDNRNETHSFTCTLCNTNVTMACSVDANGFCTYGCYEPAENVSGVYQVTNAGNLYWFAAYVNSGNFSAKAVLTDNIVVNENLLNADGTLSDNSENFRKWTPIGQTSAHSNAYSGKFDGDGHTISGLYVNGNADYVGFIGYLSGTVEDLRIEDSYFQGNENVGAVAGYVHGGALEKCYNAGTVSGSKNVGGLTGYIYGTGAVKNCSNAGSVSSSSKYVGGVVGSSYTTVENCHNTGSVSGPTDVGGVVGETHGLTTNCYNTGSVTGSANVGGVVGTITAGDYSAGEVSDSYNTGTVSGTGSNVGGLVGKNENAVTKSYNTGTVNGQYFVGGLVGFSEKGSVTNSYNQGTVSGSEFVGGLVGRNKVVANSYNTGTVSGTRSVGSVVGYNDGGTTQNCYYLAVGETNDNAAKTAAAFASGEVACLLQNGVKIGETTYSGADWGQILGQHTAPVFTETKVYFGYISCAENAQQVYSNNSAADDDKPGHTLAYESVDGNTHKQACENCDYETASENHRGGTATCTTVAVCDACKASYGAQLPHNYTYVTDDDNDTITESCDRGCGHNKTIRLKAPANLVYDGTKKEATVDGTILADYAITYNTDAVKAGNFTATLTVKTVSVSLDFIVEKADPTYEIPAGLTATYGSTLADVNNLPTGFAWTDATQSVGNAGTNTFTATFTPADTANYNVITGIEVPVQVAPKAVTSANITVSGTHTYTGAQIKPDVTVAAYAADTDYDVAYSNNINAGTATVTVTFKGNYSGTVTETFRIGKAMLTVTADNKSATTGFALPALTYTITGFVGGETASVLTAQPAAATTADGKTKGTYDITVSGAAAANYDFTYVKGTLTVADHVHAWSYGADGAVITATCGNADTCDNAKQTITLVAPTGSMVYDGQIRSATISGSIDGVTAPEITYTGDRKSAGNHTASITVGDVTASVDFTVTPATPVITWSDHTVTYTGKPADLPALTITLVNGETFSGSVTCTYDDGKPGTPTDAGTYEVTASIAAALNYTSASKTIQLTINKAASVLTGAPEAGTLTYNGQDQALVTAGTATDGTVKYRLSQNDSFSAAIPTGKNAGTYTVYYMVEGDANHNDIAESSVEVTIAKAVAEVETIPVQKHFRTYATSNSLDLTGFLPADRGDTACTLRSVTGDFFAEGTAVTNGTLNYTTKVTGADTDGSIAVDVVMANYADVTLTVAVKRVEMTAQTNQQTVKNELTTVPAGLTGTSFNTVEDIKAAQYSVLTQLLKDPQANVIHYDMKLQYSPDGGMSWVDATPENFPAEGVTVTLPYPSGTGKNTHNFAVSHMFTAGSAGTVETPKVTKTDTGIEFTLTGMSPVSVGWSAIQFNVAVAGTSHGNVAVSHTKAPAGTAVTVVVTPNYGYRLSTLTVRDAAGNYYSLGATNDDTYLFRMPAADVTVTATFVLKSSAAADPTNPKTGDDFRLLFWSGMMMTTMLGVSLLLDNRKKFLGK